MTPTTGTTLDRYRLEEKIGAGGMGEVWRATDLTLDRLVAVKILPEAFSADPQRVARFEREAKLLASLNHANIAMIHGLHSALGLHFLAMELVSGEDLAERLKRGALPVEEAIDIARQLAEALEAAHDSGVVHRDLKPANIQITTNGRLKVLDFGLAKAFETDPTSSKPALSHSPTMTAAATMVGVILGTAAYMSPEQARGLPADRRADIWAFGCVLYETLTGRRLFEGETVSDTLAAVLKTAPDWLALPSSTPAGIRTLLRRCLEKDPKRRLQAIGDARIAIEETLARPEEGEDRPGRMPAGAPGLRRRELLAWMAAAALGVICLALAAGATLRTTPGSPASMVRASLNPPPHTSFDFAAERSGALSFSPDGRYVTFPLRTADGDKSLWIRPLDSLEARPLQGTRGAGWTFWSPDSQQIAFFAGGKLKRIDLAGSPPITICDAPDGRGGDWSRDGIILLAPVTNGGIFRVPASGGQPQAITQLDLQSKETTHRWPIFLPDGRHFLFLAGSHSSDLHSEANAVYLAELGKEGRRRLLLARSNIVYDSGHLLYVRDRALLVQGFDPDRLELTGDPASIAENVAIEPVYFRSVFASSRGGSLIFQTASAGTAARLTWLGRDGKPIGKAGDISGFQGSSQFLTLSPDGKRAAYSQTDPESGRANIWISDFERGVRSRLTFEPVNITYGGLWSPDGQQIVYSIAALHDDLYVRKASGSNPEVLVHADSDKEATDWSRDGRYLVFNSVGSEPGATWDLWVLPLGEKDKLRPFVDTVAVERGGRFSPDSRWMLYTSDESGRTEVYVVPFPGPGGKWQVSNGGATTAWWTREGKEIVYLTPDLTFMSVPVRSTPTTFVADTPRPLFRQPLALAADVTRDGQRFLMVLRPEDEQQEPLTLVTNWPAGLKHP